MDFHHILNMVKLFLALDIIFLFIKILLSFVISFENAKFTSPLEIPNTNLSKNPNFNPAFPLYVDV